jgi:hypothetical protein
MTPYEFGQQLGGRMKAAGMLGDAYTLGGQMMNNSARMFKGMMGSTAGHAGGLLALGAGAGMQAANLPAQALNAIGSGVNSLTGQQTVGKIPQPFSQETVDTAHGTGNTLANIGAGYGRDVQKSLGFGGPNNGNSVLTSGSDGDAAWKNLLQQPGVSDGARDFSSRAFNVVDTASNLAPAAVIGTGAQQAFKALPAANTAFQLPKMLQPAMNTAKTVQNAYGTTSRLNAGGNLVYSGITTPH